MALGLMHRERVHVPTIKRELTPKEKRMRPICTRRKGCPILRITTVAKNSGKGWKSYFFCPYGGFRITTKKKDLPRSCGLKRLAIKRRKLSEVSA